MKKYVISLACLVFAIAFLAGNASAVTINTASCSRSDVQSAVNSANDGDTVNIPAGDCTWTSYVAVAHEITIKGAGVGNTIIHRFGFMVNHGVDNFRITGFTFDGDGASSSSNWGGTSQAAIKLGQSYGDTGNKDFRIDHNRFEDYREPGSSQGTGVLTIIIWGFSYGVIDHNDFYDCRGEVISYQADGAPAFSRPGIGGYTNGAVFVEDNSFRLSSNDYGDALNAVDGNSGARFVIRHNTVTDSATSMWYDPWEIHGHCFGGNRYGEGGYSMEIYDNTYTSSYASTGIQKNFAVPRGGTGVIYSNTVTGSFTYDIRLINYRSFQDCTYGGLCEENEGYPCLEQIGASQGDYYIWDNTRNGNPFNVYINDWGDQREHIQLNRDYWRSAPPGGYTPYPYPHPLTMGGGATTGCGDDACASDESCKSCPADCGNCPSPSTSLTNSNTMTSNSDNFASNRQVENLWDGSTSTADDSCTSGNTGISSFWVEFDLGKEYDLTSARLFGDTTGTWISRTWQLQYKVNTTDSWTTAFSGINAFIDGWSNQSISVTARYVRVEVFSDTGATQARELELYGTPLRLNYTTLCNNNTFIASSENFRSDNPPDNLWDGCLESTSECSSGNSGISSFWLEFDFGDVYDLTSARLFGDSIGDWVSKTWQLQFKLNPTDSWTTAFSNANAFFNDWSEHSLDSKARYARAEVFSDTGSTQAIELEIYGTLSTGSSCNSLADSNSDRVISISELINYISQWKSGSVTIGNLIDAIGKWKSGC